MGFTQRISIKTFWIFNSRIYPAAKYELNSCQVPIENAKFQRPIEFKCENQITLLTEEAYLKNLIKNSPRGFEQKWPIIVNYSE